MRVLVTGFEPFGEYSENSSWEVAQKVASYGIEGAEVVAERLPVSFARAGEILRSAIDLHTPDLLIMLGQSAVADRIKLERVALNMMDSKLPDNDGYIPNEEPITIETPAALFTNTPIKSLRAAIEEQGISVKISNSCGLYVCNRLYYEALMLCKKCHMKSICIHLPFYEGQPSAKPNRPTMPLNDMVKAIQTIIEKTNDKNREF